MPGALRLADRMVRAARAGALDLLGICLGAQVIAECLAPRSTGRGDRMCAGLVEVEWHRPDGEGEPRVLPSFHYEQIDARALQGAGATVVASNPAVPLLAFRWGAHIGATQLHPEFTPRDVAALVDHNEAVIARFGGDADAARRRDRELSPRWTGDAFRQVLERLL